VDYGNINKILLGLSLSFDILTFR